MTSCSLLKMSRPRHVSLVDEGNFAKRHDGSCMSRFLFMCCGDRHRSYLEHITDHNDFTRNGVHYVQWSDVIFNLSGRPALGWKMLWILLISIVITYIGVNNLTGTSFDDGLDKDTLGYLTFGVVFLLTWRLGQSYTRYNDARVNSFSLISVLLFTIINF